MKFTRSFMTYLGLTLALVPFHQSFAGGVIGGGSTGGGLVHAGTRPASVCRDGQRTTLSVIDAYASGREVYEFATCQSGKWIFDKDIYNYKPTKGGGRCKEGQFEYALKHGVDGNPFAKDKICRDGKWVELN